MLLCTIVLCVFVIYTAVIVCCLIISLGAITYCHSVLRPQEEIERLRLKARAATFTVDSKQWPTGPSANKKTAEAPSSKEVQPFSFQQFYDLCVNSTCCGYEVPGPPPPP